MKFFVPPTETTTFHTAWNKSSLIYSGRQPDTITGLILLASIPCKWHLYWLYDRRDVDHLNAILDTHLTRQGPQTTTLVANPPLDKNGIFGVFQLHSTDPDEKFINLDGCSRRNTECTPSSSQRLGRLCSLI